MLQESVGPHALPKQLNENTRLLGAIAELDSMALLGLLTQVEERFGVKIDDQSIEASLFETFGSLRRFVAGLVQTPTGSALE